LGGGKIQAEKKTFSQRNEDNGKGEGKLRTEAKPSLLFFKVSVSEETLLLETLNWKGRG